MLSGRMNAEEYSRLKAAPPGSNFYYSILFQPPESRHALIVLFAFHYEIHEALLASSDPGVARIRLQWWRDELQRLFDHQSDHPLSVQLRAVVEKFGIHTSSLLNYMNAMELLVTSPSGSSIHDWIQNHYGGLAGFWNCAGQIAGSHHDDSLLINARNGVLVMFFEIVQNLRTLLARGFNPLPVTVMEQLGTGNMDLLANPGAGSRLFTGVIDHLITALDECHGNFPVDERRKLLFSLVLNRLTTACCEEIRSDGYRLLDHRISLTPVRKLWIAVRTGLFV